MKIALPQDLDDLQDLGVSMECDLSTNDSCLQGRKRDQQCIEEHGQMEQKHQTWHTSQTRKHQQLQEYFLTRQHYPQEMVHNDIKKWKKPYEHKLQPLHMG